MAVENGSQTQEPSAVPRHVAIIMDGNSRWAKKHGLNTAGGHRAGVEVVRGLLEYTR
ncbi:MAG: undecaprenyl diphosphate synthase family protein, partial [Spongiibacter sp.]